MLIDDLLSRRENIREAMEQGTFVLLICGGYQLFGQYYISADNEKIEGLKFSIIIRLPAAMEHAVSAISPYAAIWMVMKSLLLALRTTVARPAM